MLMIVPGSSPNRVRAMALGLRELNVEATGIVQQAIRVPPGLVQSLRRPHMCK